MKNQNTRNHSNEADKDMPEHIKQMIEAVASTTPSGAWGASLIAVILSALRIMGDEHSNKWHRMALEIPTAGCIGYSTGVLLLEQGLGFGAALVAGTVIGHLGTDWVRSAARKIVDKRIGK